MSWLKKIAIFSAFGALTACGVKGDPLPPEKPAALGRGRPTYRRASEEIKIEKARPKTGDDDEERE